MVLPFTDVGAPHAKALPDSSSIFFSAFHLRCLLQLRWKKSSASSSAMTPSQHNNFVIYHAALGNCKYLITCAAPKVMLLPQQCSPLVYAPFDTLFPPLYTLDRINRRLLSGIASIDITTIHTDTECKELVRRILTIS